MFHQKASVETIKMIDNFWQYSNLTVVLDT